MLGMLVSDEGSAKLIQPIPFVYVRVPEGLSDPEYFSEMRFAVSATDAPKPFSTAALARVRGAAMATAPIG
jgi:hypothetical protein